MKRLTRSKPTIRETLHEFFFAEQVPFGAALVRMALPVAALLPMLMRFPRVRELYSTDGTPVQMFELYGQGEVLPVLPPGPATLLYSLMVFSLLCGSAGWHTRISLAVGTVLYTYFNFLDGVGTMTKYSVIAAHLLLLLTISNCGYVWSVDEYLRRRRQPDRFLLPRVAAVWPLRLMQLLYAFIYFGAAVTKIQTSAFFSGEQMRYWMLSNWNYENPVGEWMALWPPVLLVSAYITCIWEIVFGFLVWNPRCRLPVLAIGAGFHFMTWLTLGLYIFPAICLAGYFCFATRNDVFTIGRWLQSRSIIQKLSNLSIPHPPAWIPSGITWVLAASLFGVVSLEAELQRDLFGSASESGMLQLTEIDAAVAVERIRSERPLREKDKVFSFNLGHTIVGGQLASRQNEFEMGEVVLAECNLNPPHEDMWIECALEDNEFRKIESYGQYVTREMLRAHFTYSIGTRVPPGEYYLVLESAGEEIARRSFKVTGEDSMSLVAPQLATN